MVISIIHIAKEFHLSSLGFTNCSLNNYVIITLLENVSLISELDIVYRQKLFEPFSIGYIFFHLEP